MANKSKYDYIYEIFEINKFIKNSGCNKYLTKLKDEVGKLIRTKADRYKEESPLYDIPIEHYDDYQKLRLIKDLCETILNKGYCSDAEKVKIRKKIREMEIQNEEALWLNKRKAEALSKQYFNPNATEEENEEAFKEFVKDAETFDVVLPSDLDYQSWKIENSINPVTLRTFLEKNNYEIQDEVIDVLREYDREIDVFEVSNEELIFHLIKKLYESKSINIEEVRESMKFMKVFESAYSEHGIDDESIDDDVRKEYYKYKKIYDLVDLFQNADD